MSLPDRYVENFNNGVRTGDWAPMLALTTDDVELGPEPLGACG
jgi:hypothetical protein